MVPARDIFQPLASISCSQYKARVTLYGLYLSPSLNNIFVLAARSHVDHMNPFCEFIWAKYPAARWRSIQVMRIDGKQGNTWTAYNDGFVKIDNWISLSSNMDFSELLHRFVKIDTWIQLHGGVESKEGAVRWDGKQGNTWTAYNDAPANMRHDSSQKISKSITS